MSGLERLVRIESGHTLAQWFARDASGAGQGLPVAGCDSLNNRRLPAGAFPELPGLGDDDYEVLSYDATQVLVLYLEPEQIRCGIVVVER